MKTPLLGLVSMMVCALAGCAAAAPDEEESGESESAILDRKPTGGSEGGEKSDRTGDPTSAGDLAAIATCSYQMAPGLRLPPDARPLSQLRGSLEARLRRAYDDFRYLGVETARFHGRVAYRFRYLVGADVRDFLVEPVLGQLICER